MSWCERFGHKFRPRYNEQRTIKNLKDWWPETRMFTFAIEPTDLARLLVDEKITYVCDVCVRCGETRKPDTTYQKITS